MPKVKLTESELRKVVQTILNEQDPPALPDAADIGAGYSALETLPLDKIINESPLCKSLADLCSLAGGTTIRSFKASNLAYRYGLLAKHAIQEFGMSGVQAIPWNDDMPTAPTDAAKQYLKILFLALVTGKTITLEKDAQGDPGFNIEPDENTDDLGYIVDPNTPALAYWPGVFKNYGAADETCLKAIKPEVTELKVIASAEVWNKLDNQTWVDAVIKNWQTLVRQADPNGKGFAYCDQPEAVQAAQAKISAEISSTIEEFNKTYKLVDTAAFDAFFVVPLMYPSIWRAVKDETSPLYTPWSMTLSVCNMMNNALSLPGGGAALAKKLAQAGSKGLEGQGAQASISGFDPRRTDQFLFLRESARIMVTLPELRRVIHAAFRTIISEQRLTQRNKHVILKEGVLGTLFRAGRDAVSSASSGAARSVRTAEDEAAAASRLAKSLATMGVDPDVAKHYDRLFALIEGLTDEVRAIVLNNIESKTLQAYQDIMETLKATYFAPANTRFTPLPGRTLQNVLSEPCVIPLNRYAAPQMTPDILERVRVLLNCGAALATAQRAENAGDILTYAEQLKDILRVSSVDRAKMEGIINSLPANDVSVNVSATSTSLFGGSPTDVVASALSEDAINYGLTAAQKLTTTSIDLDRLDAAANAIAIEPRGVQLRTGGYIRFLPVDARRPGEFVELDPSMSALLGGKRFLSDVSVDEIRALRGGSGGVSATVKNNLIAVRMFIERAVADSVAEVEDQSRVVDAARRAVVDDASEGVVRGALTNVRAFFADSNAAARQFTQGAEAAEGQGFLSMIGSLGGFKYDPDTADQFWAQGLSPAARTAALAQFAGRLTFFFEKGLPRYADEAATRGLNTLGARGGPIGKGLKVAGKVGQALFTKGYSRRVTNTLEALAEKFPALKLDKLARTNWAKMWLTKSIVTALASIVLAKTGGVGPQWEADHPRLATFANLLMTINNPNAFQFGMFEVAGLLFKGSDPTASFDDGDKEAIFDSDVPDLLINALKSLDINAKPDPGSFPSLMKNASPSTGINFDDIVADTSSVVLSVFASIMNAGTDAGREAAEVAEAELSTLSDKLQVQINNAKAAAAGPERGLGSLDAGNAQYTTLETLRLDIIKTMISKIEAYKAAGTLQFQTLGYQNLNVEIDKIDTLSSGWDIWYGLRNSNEMVAMSSVLVGNGPIGPSGASAATLDDIAKTLIAAGAPVDPNDTTTPELQKLNAKFMKLSEQWQDLLVTQAAQAETGTASSGAAPEKAKP